MSHMENKTDLDRSPYRIGFLGQLQLRKLLELILGMFLCYGLYYLNLGLFFRNIPEGDYRGNSFVHCRTTGTGVGKPVKLRLMSALSVDFGVIVDE